VIDVFRWEYALAIAIVTGATAGLILSKLDQQTWYQVISLVLAYFAGSVSTRIRARVRS